MVKEEKKDPKDVKEKMKEVARLTKQPLDEREPKKRTRRTRAEIEAERKKGDVLTQTANPLFIPILKIPFDAWADGQKVKELKLTSEEADKLALPVTQLVEYYLPRLPAIAYAWGSLVLVSFNLLSSRIKIIKTVRVEREKEKKPPEEQK